MYKYNRVSILVHFKILQNNPCHYYQIDRTQKEVGHWEINPPYCLCLPTPHLRRVVDTCGQPLT